MRKGIYKDKKRNTWYIATKVKIGDDFKTFTKRGYLTARDADNDFNRAVQEFIKNNEPHCKVMFWQDLVYQYKSFIDVLGGLLKEFSKNDEIKVYIGNESEIDENSTVIKRKYNINGEEGTIAIIGPKRMEYQRVVAMLDYLKENIER